LNPPPAGTPLARGRRSAGAQEVDLLVIFSSIRLDLQDSLQDELAIDSSIQFHTMYIQTGFRIPFAALILQMNTVHIQTTFLVFHSQR
jgi:hypothetical protein